VGKEKAALVSTSQQIWAAVVGVYLMTIMQIFYRPLHEATKEYSRIYTTTTRLNPILLRDEVNVKKIQRICLPRCTLAARHKPSKGSKLRSARVGRKLHFPTKIHMFTFARGQNSGLCCSNPSPYFFRFTARCKAGSVNAHFIRPQISSPDHLRISIEFGTDRIEKQRKCADWCIEIRRKS
jgi:hypothetical protein